MLKRIEWQGDAMQLLMAMQRGPVNRLAMEPELAECREQREFFRVALIESTTKGRENSLFWREIGMLAYEGCQTLSRAYF